MINELNIFLYIEQKLQIYLQVSENFITKYLRVEIDKV